MANTSYTQQALAADAVFKAVRVRAALSKVAWEVLSEAVETPSHELRANYARNVLSNLDSYVNQIAPWLVMRTNLFAFETSFSFEARAVVSAAGDADIESQLATDWNALAGVPAA